MDARTLQIWQIAETYPPEYGGGAAIYIQDVCRYLASRGHEVRVLCTTASDAEPYTLHTDYDGPIRVERLNLPYFKTQDPDGWTLGTSKWLAHQRRVAALVQQLGRAWRPDIVHYNASRPLGEECLIAIEREGLPVVAMFHEAWVMCARVMLLRSPSSQPCPGPSTARCLECMYSHYDGSRARALLKLPWRLLKLGPYPAYRLWRRWVARQGLQGGMGYSRFITEIHRPHVGGLVRYVPLGINCAGLPRERPDRPRSPLRFGFIGGNQASKGLDLVLDATAVLRDEGLAFEVHVWGPGQEACAAEVGRRCLESHVRLRGVYGAADLWNVYAEMDVALMATRVSEPFGRVPQEAAAMGAPSIAPAVGGITEQIRHGEDGLLFEFGNPADLARQMRRVLTEPDLLPKLVQNLWDVPDTRIAAGGVEAFYRDVLAGRAAAPARMAKA